MECGEGINVIEGVGGASGGWEGGGTVWGFVT